MMIVGLEKVGQAFYNSKFYCTTNYGWDHYAEYINMYTFNLFGDPSLTREGIDVAGVLSDDEETVTTNRAQLAAGPSPATGSVSIHYYLPSPTTCTLEIFDVRGRRVRSISAPGSSPGWHEAVWDGCLDSGSPCASGIYWVRLSLPEQDAVVRILTVK
jgi:hypothetical protein